MSDIYRHSDLEWGGTPFYQMTPEQKSAALARDEAQLRRQQAWKEGRHEQRDERDIDIADTLKAISNEMAAIRVELQRQAKEIAWFKKTQTRDNHQPSTRIGNVDG